MINIDFYVQIYVEFLTLNTNILRYHHYQPTISTTMKYKAAIIAIASLFLSLKSEAADTIEWDSVNANITVGGSLTVEVTLTVHLDRSNGLISLYLQNKEKALGDPQEANVTVDKGDTTVTLKRTITISKGLTEIDVWTPLYVASENQTSIAEMGKLKISWRNPRKPTITVMLP
jgi:hypothetical protein